METLKQRKQVKNWEEAYKILFAELEKVQAQNEKMEKALELCYTRLFNAQTIDANRTPEATRELNNEALAAICNALPPAPWRTE